MKASINDPAKSLLVNAPAAATMNMPVSSWYGVQGALWSDCSDAEGVDGEAAAPGQEGAGGPRGQHIAVPSLPMGPAV
eukprot:1148609-Pelagomonas_calceolata.AAC.6